MGASLKAGYGRWIVGRARRRLRVARHWQAAADLDDAARDAYRALRLVGRHRPMPATLAADIALTLAQIERDRDDATASRAHLDHAIDLLQPATGPMRDQLLAWALIGLGDCHRRAARYADATEVLDRSLRLVKGGEAAPPALLASLFTELGITAKETGDFDQAERWYAEVHRLQRDSGATPADEATLQHNLAGLEYSRQRYPQAEEHARRAVALRRDVPRVTQVDIATDLAVLASVVARQHRHDEARELLGQALTACRAARPPRRYEIAVQLHNLADVEQAAGQPVDAERLYRQALDIKEQLLGPDHPEVGVVLNNLGTLLHEQHREDVAAGCFRRALAIAERAYQPDHPAILGIRRNIDRLSEGRRGPASL
jgi:tetratricopeptide (TPR) repeat protein